MSHIHKTNLHQCVQMRGRLDDTTFGCYHYSTKEKQPKTYTVRLNRLRYRTRRMMRRSRHHIAPNRTHRSKEASCPECLCLQIVTNFLS